jgi:MFS family permease
LGEDASRREYASSIVFSSGLLPVGAVERRSTVALGVGQCVNWGVLYYAFAVLVPSLERELGVAAWVVTGAFSVALLMSAFLAPAVGRWSDSDRGALVMQIGGLGAAALLAAWTLLPGVLSLYIVWASLGLCMAATLYEPAFTIVGRAHDEPAERLRAIAAITLCGGLASTLFIPGTAYLVRFVGWRVAVVVLAALLVLSTLAVRIIVFRRLPRPSGRPRSSDSTVDVLGRRFEQLPLVVMTAVLAFGSFSSAAFTANLMPAFDERGVSPEKAAMLGGFMGVMQLPGRALVMNGRMSRSPQVLVTSSLGLQAAGLAGVAFARPFSVIVMATVLFALGAGLTTLIRPYVTHTIFGGRNEGYVNGQIARQQQFARALGPFVAAWLAGVLGYAAMLAVIAATFTAAALMSGRAFRSFQSHHTREETR